VLVDTSVWIDHLRRGNATLTAELARAEVWCHPFVIGEIACGRLKKRREILSLLRALPRVPVADHDEVLVFVERNSLDGSGLGWIDAHLLASAKLSNIPIWTLDPRLASQARAMQMNAEPQVGRPQV